MSSGAIIQAESLSKSYNMYSTPMDRLKQLSFGWRRTYFKEFWALENVSFSVEPGTAFGLIGQNGAGKTTLLQLISGVLTPTQGLMRVRGKMAALLELGSGFSPEFTGRENAMLYGAMLGIDGRRMRKKMPAIESFADIGEFVDRPVRTYSAGMMLRLAFAVATHVEADILVIDEALAVGDVFFQSKCYDKLDELKSKGVTLLLVTHDMSVALTHCDAVGVLDRGRLVYAGDPRMAVEKYYSIRAVSAGSRPIPSERPGVRVAGELIRYGSGEARLRAFWVNGQPSPSAIEIASGSEMIVDAEYAFTDTVDEPVCGVMIRNHKGLDLGGENSRFRKINLGHWVTGDVLKVRYSLKMHLNNGPYLLTITMGRCGRGDGFEYIDRYVDACQLSVTGGPHPFMGVCDLEGSVMWERNHDRG